MACLMAGSGQAIWNDGMIDKTDMEAQAIKDARRPFAEVLAELGLMEPFFGRNPDEIDRIIEACIDGFQDLMRRQAGVKNNNTPFDDQIPF